MLFLPPGNNISTRMHVTFFLKKICPSSSFLLFVSLRIINNFNCDSILVLKCFQILHDAHKTLSYVVTPFLQMREQTLGVEVA